MAKVGLKGTSPIGHSMAEDKPTRRSLLTGAVALGAALALSACNTTEVRNHGFIMPDSGLEQVPVGSSKNQVLIVLGTPQTTATLDNEVFYYISQRSEQTFAFSRPEITDQRVLAVYFDENELVAQIADYGLQDGVIFDFVSETTPTGGADLTFVGQILGGLGSAPTNIF